MKKKQQTIKDCILAARKSIESRPSWMKKVSYFAAPIITKEKA